MTPRSFARSTPPRSLGQTEPLTVRRTRKQRSSSPSRPAQPLDASASKATSTGSVNSDVEMSGARCCDCKQRQVGLIYTVHPPARVIVSSQAGGEPVLVECGARLKAPRATASPIRSSGGRRYGNSNRHRLRVRLGAPGVLCVYTYFL